MDAVLTMLAAECSGWLKANFPGAFAAGLLGGDHPSCLFMTTRFLVPFDRAPKALRWPFGTGLDDGRHAWDSEDWPGLRLGVGDSEKHQTQLWLAGRDGDFLQGDEEYQESYGGATPEGWLNRISDEMCLSLVPHATELLLQGMHAEVARSRDTMGSGESERWDFKHLDVLRKDATAVVRDIEPVARELAIKRWYSETTFKPGPDHILTQFAEHESKRRYPGPTLRHRHSSNLYEKGDFVSQYTPYWCIGASMQMMLGIIGVDDDTGRAAQEGYMRVARSSGESLRQIDHGQTADNAGGLRGAGSSGWARGLVELGAGGYVQRALDGYTTSLRTAAYALRKTGRPVGLIVWRGAHAWVMTGFTATADPLVDPDFRLTGVFVQDPWYPRVSSIWGPGQEPNTWISTKTLKLDFLPRRGGRWHAELAGKYVIVLPVEPIRLPDAKLRWMI